MPGSTIAAGAYIRPPRADFQEKATFADRATRGCQRSRRAFVRNAGQIAAAVLVAVLAVAAPASAEKTKLQGQVIGQPYAAKKRTAVMVLVDAKSARRARLKSRVGVLEVKARKVRAPRGKRIPAMALRTNDRVQTRLKLRRKARRAAFWQVATRKLVVKK